MPGGAISQQALSHPFRFFLPGGEGEGSGRGFPEGRVVAETHGHPLVVRVEISRSEAPLLTCEVEIVRPHPGAWGSLMN